MITLDQAIDHCKEKARELKQQAETDYFPIVEDAEKADCLECANEHEQLAEWLKELKRYRECGCIRMECTNCGGCDNGR